MARGEWLWPGNLQISIYIEIAAKGSLCQRDLQLLRFELPSRGMVDPLSASSQTQLKFPRPRGSGVAQQPAAPRADPGNAALGSPAGHS